MSIVELPNDPDNRVEIPQDVERTDPFKGEFSPSSIELAKCYRRYYYEKVLKMKPNETPTALIFGICIHDAVELFYKLKAEGTVDFVEAKIAVVKKFASSWQKFGIIGDHKRNMDAGVICMSNYVDRYWEEFAEFKLEEIETKQWYPMPNGALLLVKMDRVLNMMGKVDVVDTKTTSMPITDWYFKQFENHLPTSLYFFTVEAVLGRCDSIIIDAIKVPPPPTTTSTTEPFGRQTFLRTDLQVEDAVRTFIKRSDYIMEGLKKPKEEWADHFYCNQGECDKYGGCPFLPVCRHGFEHPSVKVDFTIGER